MSDHMYASDAIKELGKDDNKLCKHGKGDICFMEGILSALSKRIFTAL